MNTDFNSYIYVLSANLFSSIYYIVDSVDECIIAIDLDGLDPYVPAELDILVRIADHERISWIYAVFLDRFQAQHRFRFTAIASGIERIAMLKYGINNIGLLYENDLRFLKQFKD